MAKFTKGPWKARHDGRDGMVVCPDGRSFLVGDIIYHEENIANAHLIAAAPDMYEALKDLLNYDYEDAGLVPHSIIGPATDALAKADGEINNG